MLYNLVPQFMSKLSNVVKIFLQKIGGFQCKLKPSRDPRLLKMKSRLPPRLLPDVVQAIHILGKPTSTQIVQFIKKNYTNRRAIVNDILKALYYAEDIKIITNKQGKYCFHLKNKLETPENSGNFCINCLSMLKKKKEKKTEKIDKIPDTTSTESDKINNKRRTPKRRTGKDKRLERRKKGTPVKIGKQVATPSSSQIPGAESKTKTDAATVQCGNPNCLCAGGSTNSNQALNGGEAQSDSVKRETPTNNTI